MLTRSLSVPHVYVGGSETKTKGLLTRRCGKGHTGLRGEAELEPDMPELIAGGPGSLRAGWHEIPFRPSGGQPFQILRHSP